MDPGDVTGTEIYVVAAGQTDDDLWFNTIDTSDDSFGVWTKVNTTDGIAYSAAAGSGVAVTKAANGRLFAGICGTFGAANTLILAYSDDGGSSWTQTTPPVGSPLTAAADTLQLLPLVAGNDVILIQQDVNVGTMRYSIWDGAGASWSTPFVTFASWYAQNGNYDYHWGASLWKSTGDIYFVGDKASGAVATVGPGGLEVFKFTEASRTWAQLTEIIADDLKGETAGARVLVDENNGNLYVVYFRGNSVGGDGVQNKLGVYYKLSSDGGATWAAETRLNASWNDDDFRVLSVNMMSDDRLYAVWSRMI